MAAASGGWDARGEGPAVGGAVVVAGGLIAYGSEVAETGTVSHGRVYFSGWRNFKVTSWYIISRLIPCPSWYDIDFNVSGTDTIDSSGILEAVGNSYSPSPNELTSKEPNPNAWDSWSDTSIIEVNK